MNRGVYMDSVNFEIYELSNQIIDFCERNNITKNDLNKLSELGKTNNEKVSRYNPLVSWFGIRDINGPEEKDIYIKDIAGFEPYDKAFSLYTVLGNCYSDNNQTYGIRANDRLKLSKDEMIKDMKDSFSYEPICVDEVEGKKFVSHNGCHRVSILKLLYLDEVLKNEKPINEIDEKYKIKVKESKYDMTLTYIHFFMQMIRSISYMKLEYNELGKPTGKYVVETRDNKSILSKEEVINLFNETINNNLDKIDTYYVNSLTIIPSFKKFLRDYLPSLLKEIEHANSRNNM